MAPRADGPWLPVSMIGNRDRAPTPPRGRSARTGAERSRPLRDSGQALLIEAQLLHDALVAPTVDDAQVVDHEPRVDEHAPELVVVPRLRQLSGGSLQPDVSRHLAVGVQQHDIEGLDASLLLHPAVEADGLAEHLQAALLATPYGSAPADEQHAISHVPVSLRLGPAPVPDLPRHYLTGEGRVQCAGQGVPADGAQPSIARR